MTYGRNGTPEEIAEARKVLAGLQWAPFKPSSNAQLYPIRQLELNKEVLKVKADAKLSDAEKEAKLAELQKEIDKVSQQAAKTPSM
jgi:phosphonate transport system substrate-binding protein